MVRIPSLMGKPRVSGLAFKAEERNHLISKVKEEILGGWAEQKVTQTCFYSQSWKGVFDFHLGVQGVVKVVVALCRLGLFQLPVCSDFWGRERRAGRRAEARLYAFFLLQLIAPFPLSFHYTDQIKSSESRGKKPQTFKHLISKSILSPQPGSLKFLNYFC